MNKKNINTLLDDYYKGETSLEQEAALRDHFIEEDGLFQEEKDIFQYYEHEAFVPEKLEEQIFENIRQQNKSTKIMRSAWVRYTSIAAAVCLVATILWFNHKTQPSGKLSEDEQFAILEHALLEISNSVQPAKDQDLLVLFQDENLEIVMN